MSDSGVVDAPAMPDLDEETLLEELSETDAPWIVLLWDDPINTMNYVAHVLRKLFGYSREKAWELMLQVHHEGKAVVANGARSEAERNVARLHAYGLWATMQKDR
jgi:ATP-dependent Clp protease adaptor protein ClpS